MAEIKDKVVTAESLKALHEYNKKTYLPLSGGTLTGGLNGTTVSTTQGISCDGNLRVGNITNTSGIEIFSSVYPYIDFHYGDNTSDYTSRIIERKSGTLDINGLRCATGGDVSFTGMMILSSNQYGDALPAAGTKGRIFFKKLTE